MLALRRGEGIEQGGFAGIGVAHQGDGGHAGAPAAPAAALALAMHTLQALPDDADARVEHPGVQLDLLFPGATQADAAALPIQVCPTPRHPGAGVVELGEFDLQLSFPCAGAGREDVQDELGARHHPAAQAHLQVALLGGREVVVGDEQIRFAGGERRADLIELALPHEPAWMWLLAGAFDATHGGDGGGLDELREFRSRRGQRGAALAGGAVAEADVQKDGLPAGLRAFKEHGVALPCPVLGGGR